MIYPNNRLGVLVGSPTRGFCLFESSMCMDLAMHVDVLASGHRPLSVSFIRQILERDGVILPARRLDGYLTLRESTSSHDG